MWKLYDALIEGIPEELIVEDVVSGRHMTLVCTGEGGGFGSAYDIDTRLPSFSGSFIGRTLKEAAGCIKSWNYIEASVGLAAINAYYNSLSTAKENGILYSTGKYVDDRMNDPFISYQQMIKDKNVAVIGHFPYLDTLFSPVSNMVIIETEPMDGDYPYPAVEYLLPEQDYVFITCGSLINKTLPRILELSKNAKNILVGPATPMAPVLFDFGVNDLSGFVIKDIHTAHEIAAGSRYGSLYASGQKVHLKAGV